MTRNTDRRRVLITGATGGIGSHLARTLPDDYELVLHGRDPDEAPPGRELRLADLADLEEVTALMDGVDTVVHMAGASSPESSWEAVLEANIVGVRNVLEAAHRAGVRRVVLASSNHAFGMYDRHELWPVYPDQPPRADSLYGVSKVFGETLGRFYHDEHGLDVICLRIGWFSEDPLEAEEEILRAMWLSPRDCTEVVRCAIEAEVRFGLYYAISDNPDRRWSMTNTHLELGYRPRDLRHGTFPQLSGLCLANYTSDPVFQSMIPAGSDPLTTVATWAGLFGDPTLTWDDLAWLRGLTDLPIVLKGICAPDDARRAADAGMDGIYCSNHGGRQAASAPALQFLPGVVEAAGDLPVLFDSGIRTGVDAVKALALGATAVGIGRPYAYAAATGGTPAIEHLLRCLLAEMDLTMGLNGYADLAALRAAGTIPVG